MSGQEKIVKVKANHQIAYRNVGYNYGDEFEMLESDFQDYRNDVSIVAKSTKVKSENKPKKANQK